MHEVLFVLMGFAAGMVGTKAFQTSRDPIQTCRPHYRYGCAQCRFALQSNLADGAP